MDSIDKYARKYETEEEVHPFFTLFGAMLIVTFVITIVAVLVKVLL